MLNIEAVCATCKDPVNVEIKIDISTVKPFLYVHPCDSCMNTDYQKGFDDAERKYQKEMM